MPKFKNSKLTEKYEKLKFHAKTRTVKNRENIKIDENVLRKSEVLT